MYNWKRCGEQNYGAVANTAGTIFRYSSHRNTIPSEAKLLSVQPQSPLQLLLRSLSWSPVIQGRNEIRWRPGQEARFAPPCSNLRSFRSKCTVLKKVLGAFLGFFGAPSSDSALGKLCPGCLLVTPLLLSLTIWNREAVCDATNVCFSLLRYRRSSLWILWSYGCFVIIWSTTVLKQTILRLWWEANFEQHGQANVSTKFLLFDPAERFEFPTFQRSRYATTLFLTFGPVTPHRREKGFINYWIGVCSLHCSKIRQGNKYRPQSCLSI